MASVLTKTRWTIALFALLAAVFAFAPIVEAAECGVELPAAHAGLDADTGDGHEPGPQPMHGGCAHGHCHHAPSLIAPDRNESGLAPLARAGHALPMNDLRVSHAPEGLERPPRA